MTRISSPWIKQPSRRSGATRRLVCCPYAGGSAASFAAWARLLPDVELLVVQYPGREERIDDAPFTDLVALAAALKRELAPYLGEMPYAIFGHSMGALVGFELTRLIAQHGIKPPTHLFVSGCGAPQLQTPCADPRHLWPTASLIAELQRINGTPADLLGNHELMSIMLPTMRADFAVVDLYRFDDGRPLDVPLTAFGGLEDVDVSREQLSAWRRQTTARFAMAMFPGDHFYLNAAAPLLTDLVRDGFDMALAS